MTPGRDWCGAPPRAGCGKSTSEQATRVSDGWVSRGSLILSSVLPPGLSDLHRTTCLLGLESGSEHAQGPLHYPEALAQGEDSTGCHLGALLQAS